MNTPESIVTSLDWSKKLPEEWRAVEGFEGVYEVSNHGRVRRIYKDSRSQNKNGKHRILRPCNRGRYLCIELSKGNVGKMLVVSRLVAKAFIPNPENKTQVNHISGDRMENGVWNLEWVTPQENTLHAIRIGLRTFSPTIRGPHFANVA